MARSISARRRSASAGGPDFAGLRDPAFHQLQIAHDGGEHVVEVVRDAAGELADRLQLLRLVQRRLGLLASGDLDLQPVVGLGQLAGAFGDLRLQEAGLHPAFHLPRLQPGRHRVERLRQGREFGAGVHQARPGPQVAFAPSSGRLQQRLGRLVDEAPAGDPGQDQGDERGAADDQQILIGRLVDIRHQVGQHQRVDDRLGWLPAMGAGTSISGDVPETPVSDDVFETPVADDALETPVADDALETPVPGDVPKTPVPGDVPETPVPGDVPETPVPAMCLKRPSRAMCLKRRSRTMCLKRRSRTMCSVRRPRRSYVRMDRRSFRHPGCRG